MNDILRIASKVFWPIMQITIIVLLVFLWVRISYIQDDIELLQNEISKISTKEQTINNFEQKAKNPRQKVNNSEQEVDDFDESKIITLTSTSMEIIAVGVTLFTLFGGFLSLINMSQWRDALKSIEMAEKAMENQKELIASRFLQEGKLYESWHRPHYARESYNLAMKNGEDTFSALVAEFALNSMQADVLSNPIQLDELEKVEKQLKEFIEKLKSGKHFHKGRRRLRADSYFTLACIYAVCTLDNVESCEKDAYAEKANEMFESAIKEDATNPDFYLHYAAHLSGRGDIAKGKKQMGLAREYAQRDALLSEFMDTERLIDLFKLQGTRTRKEAEDILFQMGVKV